MVVNAEGCVALWGRYIVDNGSTLPGTENICRKTAAHLRSSRGDHEPQHQSLAIVEVGICAKKGSKPSGINTP